MRRVPDPGDEEASPLSGGNVADEVVRVGDTVRKPAGFWTPAVEALLSHLWAAAADYTERNVGVWRRTLR
jgi:hypothetical protein